MAKKGGLSNRRIIIARLDDIEVAGFLCDVLAPQIKRNSGYLKIEHAGYRRGDNAEMGTISFVDEFTFEAPKAAEKKEEAKKADTKKASEKKAPAAKAKKEDK
jgi:large subunit ribosomal protein L17